MKQKDIRRKKRTPASSKLTMHNALTHKGYYDKENNWNSLVTINKHRGKVFRDRVEVLIFNSKGQLYLCKENGYFRVPGGSVEKNIPNYKQVQLEALQEAKMNITNIHNTGIHYVRFFNKPYIPYNSSIYWDGVHNNVYTAEFVSRYNGDVKKSLKDMSMVRHGKFYDLRDVYDYLKPEYKKAIEIYKKRIKNKN